MSEIPKVINYCWFGGNPLGQKELACIESWRKYLPEYEIKQWDEYNFDVNCCDYVSEAYEARKWAFVSDYARFKILFENGGLYFDTDVELIRPLDDILANGPFMGFETDYGDNAAPSVAAGLGLAAYPGLGLYKTILDSYGNDHFIMPDGTLDRTSVVFRVTRLMRDLGLRDIAGIQQVAGVTVYPSEYFNPKSYVTGDVKITENTRSIHHFSMSWFTPAEKFQHDVNGWLVLKGLDNNIAGHISAVITTIRFLDFRRALRRFKRD